MMLIAIDHGNKQMKTAHHTFSSGLCESDTKPPFGENVLRYKGMLLRLPMRLNLPSHLVR